MAGLTVKLFDVPLLPEVTPVKVMFWLVVFWDSVRLTVAAPLTVAVEFGDTVPTALPRVILMVSAAWTPLVMLLLEASCAWMVTAKGIPATIGEDTGVTE